MLATQDNQLAKLVTPLGKDKLLLTHMNVTEGLSELFEIRLECLGETPLIGKPDVIDLDKLLGLDAYVEEKTVGNNTRFFCGKIIEASWFGEENHYVSYQLTLRPWFWLLTQMSGHRIFQNMTVVDILKKVFEGFDYEVQLPGSYETIEYCVQYGETHFAFASRLMEEYGIYYFFKHSENKHTLVLANSKSSHKRLPHLPDVTFVGRGDAYRDDGEYLEGWLYDRKVRSGKVTVKAFDFVKPKAEAKHESTSPGKYAAYKEMEVYQYPHKYKAGQDDLSEKFAKAKLHAAQGIDKRRYATGDAPSLMPGGLVKLKQHPEVDENLEYLVVQAHHTYSAQAYRSGSDAASGDSYEGQYVLQPSDILFRAPHLTPKPVISGPQTAIVVGPKGEEIYTDKHGRIKVQFHWDREGKNDENSSRWIRVAQVWSGAKWGGFLLPRIGMEVIVEFIEGDPDRPIVTGTVYNGDNKFPYDLPDNKTQTGIKTRSSRGGGEQDYNEFMFEDQKGSEFVRFHAQKDLKSTIENQEERLLKGKEQSGPGKFTRDTKIEKGDDNLTILNGDNNIEISNDQTVKIKHDQDIKIFHDQRVDISNDQTIAVHRDISITADHQITLKVGQSTITMTTSTIEIETPSLTVKTQTTKSDASATMILTGGIITIN